MTCFSFYQLSSALIRSKILKTKHRKTAWPHRESNPGVPISSMFHAKVWLGSHKPLRLWGLIRPLAEIFFFREQYSWRSTVAASDWIIGKTEELELSIKDTAVEKSEFSVWSNPCYPRTVCIVALGKCGWIITINGNKWPWKDTIWNSFNWERLFQVRILKNSCLHGDRIYKLQNIWLTSQMNIPMKKRNYKCINS